MDIKYNMLVDEIVNISWDAPFSLDIAYTDPDITYCIEIINKTSLYSVYSRCMINTTYHVCDSFSPLLACGEYVIHIQAVNPVGKSNIEKLTAWNKGMVKFVLVHQKSLMFI